jgi:hypothetical protein
MMLSEVLELVQARKVPLAPELAGYVVLEIAEGSTNANVVFDPSRIHLHEEGTATLLGAPQPGDGEGSLRELLGMLLEASGAQTPALAAIARKPSQAAPLTILVQELESALIPVNRAAGRRALARLAREARRMHQARGPAVLPLAPRASAPKPSLPRPTQPGAPSPARAPMPPAAAQTAPSSGRLASVPPTSGSIPATGSVLFGSQKLSEPPKAEVPFEIQKAEIDQLLQTFEVSASRPEADVARELKSMAGLEPTPPPPHVATPDEEEREDETLLSDRRLPVASARPEPVANVHVETLPSASAPPTEGLNSDVPTKIEQGPPTFPEDKRPPGKKRVQARTVKLDRVPAKKSKSSLSIAAIVALATLLTGLAAVYFFRPGLLASLHGTPPSVTAPLASLTATGPTAKACRASVVIRKAPTESEVLLRVGRAPVSVPRLPVGTRIELLATAEGYAPARGVVLPTGAWDRSGGTPHTPLKIVLSAAKPGKPAPWPPAEAGTQVGGRGEPGSVDVTSNVDGAEVWLLIGLGPEASYEPLPCSEATEFLIAGTLNYRKRLRVGPEEFAKATDGPTGQKRIELTAP